MARPGKCIFWPQNTLPLLKFCAMSTFTYWKECTLFYSSPQQTQTQLKERSSLLAPLFAPRKVNFLKGELGPFLVSYGHELVFPNTVLVIVNNLNTCPAELGSPLPIFQHPFCIYKTEIYIQHLGRCINHDAVKPEKHRPQLWTKPEKAI